MLLGIALLLLAALHQRLLLIAESAGLFVGLLEAFGRWGWALLATIIFAPIAATLIRLAISRQREYGADETGAHITHMPLSLASALQKLQA